MNTARNPTKIRSYLPYLLHEDSPVVLVAVRADTVTRHGRVRLVQLYHVEGGQGSRAGLCQDPSSESARVLCVCFCSFFFFVRFFVCSFVLSLLVIFNLAVCS